MSSDVEMLADDAEVKPEAQLINLHSPSPPPRHSPITIRDDSSVDRATPPPTFSVPPSSSGVEDGPSAASLKEQEPKKKPKAPGPARPSSSAQAAGAKPKSAKSTAVTAARSPSPSPPPPPTRPPLQTIRLEITLGGPEHYEVDISSLSKESGQRAPTPVPVKRDSSDSEGDDEGDGDGEGEGKHEKKKRRRVREPSAGRVRRILTEERILT